MRAEVGYQSQIQSVELEIRLQCPRCCAPLPDFVCESCGFHLRVESGIWRALPNERAAHFSQFVRDYERVRSAEGRGSAEADFYLNLPYKDLSGNNNFQWAIRARTFDHVTRHLLKKPARRGSVRVLDIGAGNCWMSYRLALDGYAPVAVDLLTNVSDGLSAAEHFRQSLPNLFPRFQAESAHLPFAGEQFDAVIFGASFHYSEDYSATLGEALRCVRIGGVVIIADTPWYSREESGQQMVKERQDYYRKRYGTASDSIHSQEYLTDQRLATLSQEFSIRWDIHTPWYGFKWAMRPFVARLRGSRTPSRFRIYAARKNV